ncbi:MAG: hypothetical protein E7403_02060 [Ruminococcaceae bacterium]|nr:hypothetical protein [Oscillospiraceae bacterium]
MQLIQNIFKKPSKTTIIISSIVVLLVAIIISFFCIANSTVNNPLFYNGIIIGDVAVGGMSKEEAIQAVTDRYAQALTADITLKCNNNTQHISLLELNASLDANALVETAYATCREGNFFKRFFAISNLKKNPAVFAPVISCNDDALKAAFKELSSQIDLTGKEMEYTVTETELIITRGTPGTGINTVTAIENFKNTVLGLSDGIFTVNIENIVPKEPVAAEIYNEVHSEPTDASYTITDRKLVITDHKNGIDFDPVAAQNLINQSSDAVITIPIISTPPAMTTQQLQNSLFPDLLGTYSSRYNAGDVARSHNVSLASQKINEIVLAPGDVFSYNDIVGPRTTAHGFRVANVYVGNRIEPGVGGGICQVSSTLFNAAVLADLDIVYRTNHSLPVSYVPLGRDATVSYGSIDFKFSNSTSHPIKIVASATGGTNLVSIYGTKEHPGRTISISTECIGTRAPSVTQIEDPTLPAGTIRVQQAGSSGSTYNAYKVTSENGRVIESEFLTRSTYLPSERIEIIGTAPAEESTPVDGETPIADGDDSGETPPAEEPQPSLEPEPPANESSEPTPAPAESTVSDMISNPAA